MDENSDLCVKIDNPQKHLETLETYITFRITTKVARIEFPENEYCVRRRYNDFIWLRQKLVEQHPFCIVPPLPGKHTLMGQLDRYSKEFILLRMKALNLFMFRIVQHPILSCSQQLFSFLTAKPQDFVAHRKQKQFDPNSRTPSLSNTSLIGVKIRHYEFDKMKSYLNALSDKLNCVEKISNRIIRERAEFITELNSFHPIFTTWATSEPELAIILQGIGHALERMSSSQNILVQNYNNTMANPMKDFLSYIDVVQDTMKRRETHQQAYENAIEELNKKHNQKDKLVAISQNQDNPSFQLWKQKNYDEQLEKLGTYIPQLMKKVEANQDFLECANESLRSDLERWQLEKQECIKKILLDFVNKQIEYEQSQVNAWEQITNEITASFTINNNSN
ncbi:sorting nexin-30-like isoform X2 [Coccinella septempunctata]|nr:sorting nexin-30-like isoform X2 [Coccinella septempunctata]